MSKKKQKLGLVVGRFQPLHSGHKFLIEKAIAENDIIVICIGEARKSDPLSLEERKKTLGKYLEKAVIRDKTVKIVHVEDVESDEMWVMDLVAKSGITGETANTFYFADKKLPKTYLDALKKHGIGEKIVKRISFDYRTPDRKSHKVNSATQIRKLHEDLDIPL